MSKRRLVILAVVLEGRSPSEVAASYGVSRAWVHRLVARYRAEGEAAFEPRSRRPHTSPNAIGTATVEAIIDERHRLLEAGLDAGARTIAWHLLHREGLIVPPATIWRTLQRHGLITPAPKKRPKSSYIRFAAELPNETWQSDFTHWPLANGTDTEIISWLDDHSRKALSITAHQPVTCPVVVDTFSETAATYGLPASVLTDNGLVFTARFIGGHNAFEILIDALGITQKNSRPLHPQTCGKVERFQQSMKRWLRAQPPATIAELQTQLDTWKQIYNHERKHDSLGERTPAIAYLALPKAAPTGQPGALERIRKDRIDTTGKVTLRRAGNFYKIGIGRAHAGKRIIMLINNLDVRILHHETGELLRQLTLDTTRKYQPTGAPKSKKREP